MKTNLVAHRDETTLIARDAADWLRRLQRDDPTERTAFLTWLRQSPLHVKELLLALAVDDALDGMDSEKRIDLEALIASASANVVPLPSNGALASTPRKPTRKVWPIAATAAAAALAFIAVFWNPLSLLSGGSTYATALGEQRVVALEDGSVVYLNTQSRVRETYSSTARDIYLLEGQAIFQVKHDTSRPFRVHSDNAVVQAVGTKFDVRRVDGGVEVAVIEGVVKVSPANDAPSAPSSSQKLAAGESLSVDAKSGRTSAPQPIDINDVSAWQLRRLVFRKQTLATIAAEFNRYNRVKIRIEDEAVGARRFSGTFQADDTALLIGFLQRDPSLVVAQQADAIVIAARQSSQ